LIREVGQFEVKLLKAETLSMDFRPQILDLIGFATVLGKITNYAIELIAQE
jgi:hypothetical protein